MATCVEPAQLNDGEQRGPLQPMHLDEGTWKREKFGSVRNDEERVGPLWSSNPVDKARV